MRCETTCIKVVEMDDNKREEIDVDDEDHIFIQDDQNLKFPKFPNFEIFPMTLWVAF